MLFSTKYKTNTVTGKMTIKLHGWLAPPSCLQLHHLHPHLHYRHISIFTIIITIFWRVFFNFARLLNLGNHYFYCHLSLIHTFTIFTTDRPTTTHAEIHLYVSFICGLLNRCVEICVHELCCNNWVVYLGTCIFNFLMK